jgi:RsiW-degrading membrane proteinase PrsW (M82 family)
VQAGLLLFVISFALSHLSIFLSPTPDAWMLFLYAVLGGLLFPIMLIGVLWLTLAGRSFQDIHFLLAPISGATLGIAATMVLDLVVPLVGMAFGARLALPIAVGAAEELAKMLAIWWLLKQERYNQGVHGLVAGILVGLGFAAVEDVFYTVSSLSAVHGKTVLFVILIRMMTSLAHPAWSACLAVELWREKRVTVQFTGPVVRMYLMVALLHALWDYSLLTPIFEYEKGGGPTIISAVCTLSLFLVQAKRANIPVNA